MADLQKYFLAILPPKEFREQVHDLKLSLKEEFGVKYTLKSPAHITLKMPFMYNANKEDRLVEVLKNFNQGFSPFPLSIRGVDQFRRRVLFLSVAKQPKLFELQDGLRIFGKRDLKLNLELSDTNYHPHLTVAFQDIKKEQFESIRLRVENAGLEVDFKVGSYYLLKRKNGLWEPQKEIFLAET